MLKPLKVVFGVVMLLLFAVPVFAQTVDTAWVRRYNGTGNQADEAGGIAVDDSGYVYVTGSIYNSGSGSDVGTITYNPQGDTVWVRSYNGSGNDYDYAGDLVLDRYGNIYVTGQTTGSGSSKDYITIKYHPNGDTAWLRIYDGPSHGDDIATAIAVDDSDNVYVTGRSDSVGTAQDYVTIKYNSDGGVDWISRYNGPGNGDEYPSDMATDSSGNVYITGYSAGIGTASDYATVKYLTNGDTAWVRRYNGPGNLNDRAWDIEIDGSGNVCVTGQSNGSGTSDDYATIKYYPDGDTAWVRRYNSSENGNDQAWHITADGSGNVYVTGNSDSTATGLDYVTIKYNPNGDVAWLRRYNGPGNGIDRAWAIAVDGSGNVYVTGRSGGSGTSDDYATVKYYPDGDTAWLTRYNGPGNGNDHAFSMALDSSDNVYVTGESQGDETDYDYCTIKYFQTPSDVREESGDREKPSEFDLSQNYPNPFNPFTKIEFTLARSGFVTLRIYDTLGRRVRTLVSEELSSGYKLVMWDGKNDAGDEVASGVYFYQLKVGDFSEPKKMLLLK
jgi:uncharacterized delta-60 repeat protein